MRINLRLWLAVLGMVIGLGIPAQAQNGLQSGDEFETLMQKIRQDFVANPAIDEALAKYNEQDGSFTDVDYASIQRTNWPPLVHVERISDFVFAYTNPKNKHFGEEALYDEIVKGLEFWHERNPWCHNWWYNQISEPQKLGVLLIQMRTGKKQLPADLEKKILDRVREDGGDPAKWTGPIVRILPCTGFIVPVYNGMQRIWPMRWRMCTIRSFILRKKDFSMTTAISSMDSSYILVDTVTRS